jgi:hypothetical protein
MVDEIPQNPHEQLSAWKRQRLIRRLKTDFPQASEQEMEQVVRQAAALLWPRLKFAALSASASMLVRDPLREPLRELVRGARDIPPKHAGGSPFLVEGNRQRCQDV